jgi:hypothetical protein
MVGERETSDPLVPNYRSTSLQVLYLVSLREQSTTFSLAQLYRTCTDIPTLIGDDDGYDDNVEVVKKNKGKKNKKEVKEGRTTQTKDLTC